MNRIKESYSYPLEILVTYPGTLGYHRVEYAFINEFTTAELAAQAGALLALGTSYRIVKKTVIEETLQVINLKPGIPV
jgi:hypothetical protein